MRSLGPWLWRHALGGLEVKEGAASYAALTLESADAGVGGVGLRDAVRTLSVLQR